MVINSIQYGLKPSTVALLATLKKSVALTSAPWKASAKWS